MNPEQKRLTNSSHKISSCHNESMLNSGVEFVDEQEKYSLGKLAIDKAGVEADVFLSADSRLIERSYGSEAITEKIRQTELAPGQFLELNPNESSEIRLEIGITDFRIVRPADLTNSSDRAVLGHNQFILLDPKTFNTARGQEAGFAALREGQKIVLGRADMPKRFRLSDYKNDNTMSRQHLKIGLENGQIIVWDLNSTNGSKVTEFLRQDELLNSRSEFAQVVSEVSEIEQLNAVEQFLQHNRDMRAFQDYFRKNFKQIAELVATEQMSSLEKQLYTDFYGKDERYKISPSRRAIIEYNPVDFNNHSNIFELTNGRVGMVAYDGYWSFHGTLCGDVPSEKTGRLYINLEQQVCISFQQNMSNILARENLIFLSKIPLKMTEETANRRDKMVLYFDIENLAKVNKIIAYIAKPYKAFFQDSIPRFTKNVTDGSGKIMRGIGFGQEPIQIDGHERSFGEVRSEILAELSGHAIRNGQKKLNFSDIDLVRRFRELCLKNKVSPTDFALNSDDRFGLKNSPYLV